MEKGNNREDDREDSPGDCITRKEACDCQVWLELRKRDLWSLESSPYSICEEKMLNSHSLYFNLAAEWKCIFLVIVGSMQNNMWRKCLCKYVHIHLWLPKWRLKKLCLDLPKLFYWKQDKMLNFWLLVKKVLHSHSSSIGNKCFILLLCLNRPFFIGQLRL